MKKTNNCIVLTGGGTAGHVVPNINLEKELKKHFDQIIYIGSETGIEKKLISERTDYKFLSIPTIKFNRSNLLKNFTMPFKLSKAIKAAKIILKKYKPAVVFSKGGYVGLPVTIAASQLKIPTICHESDITMGLANKIAKIFSNKICTSFEITAQKNGKKCIYTSMPLVLSNKTKAEAKAKLGISSPLPVLLITGGSLGAQAVNNVIFENIKELTKKYYVLHLVGKGNQNKSLTHIAGYKQIEFSNDMPTILRASDFAISRAGANTIIELLANNVLTLFVPLPKSVSRGDQIENAKYLESKNLSKTILQQDLTLENIIGTLEILKTNSKAIKAAIKREQFVDGTQKIISEILSAANIQNKKQ